MFKHILLPTDGSKLSDRAVQRGLELAEALGARVTAVHVIPEFRMMADESFVLPNSVDLKRRYDKESKGRAEKLLAKIGERATAAGVKVDSVAVNGDVPYEQIIDTAGLTLDAPLQTLLLNRTMVTGVVETPNGAHFTTCSPTYERDETCVILE